MKAILKLRFLNCKSSVPEIVPAVIAKNFKELQEKVKRVEPYVKTVQLDIMDGIFVPNKTWPFVVEATQDKPSVKNLDGLEISLFLEAHLMIVNPHRVLNEWLESKVGRIILHWEALEKIHNHELLPYKTQIGSRFPISNLAEEIHHRDKEFGVAMNPKTPVEVLDSFINEIDAVLLMSVDPGFAGQKFQGRVIPKIAALRAKYQNVKIGVDGGINMQNINQLVKAGADFLSVGSTIFSSDDPAGEIIKLKKIIS